LIAKKNGAISANGTSRNWPAGGFETGKKKSKEARGECTTCPQEHSLCAVFPGLLKKLKDVVLTRDGKLPMAM
jgi:hypothetical protein